MVDFRKAISPRSSTNLKSLRDEVHAARNYDNKAFACWLLGLARTLQDSGSFSVDQRYSYDEWAMYRVIPELARRIDPDVALRDNEIPDESEKADQVTWLVGADTSKVLNAAENIMEHGSFRRLKNNSPELNALRVVDMFHYFQKGSHPIGMAIDRLSPGLYPAVEPEEDTRPPLAGLFVIAESEKHDTVLIYRDDHAAVELYFAAAEKYLRRDATEAQQALMLEMFRWRIGLKENLQTVSLQTVDGIRLRIAHLKPKPEDMPSLLSIADLEIRMEP